MQDMIAKEEIEALNAAIGVNTFNTKNPENLPQSQRGAILAYAT